MEQELQRLRRYNHVAERLNAVGLFRLPHVEIPEVNDSNYHVYDPAGPHLSIYGQSGSGAIYNIARQGQVRRVRVAEGYFYVPVNDWFEPGTPRRH